jgi:hypothetical protein
MHRLVYTMKDLLIHDGMRHVGAVHEWPAAKKPTSQWWATAFCSRRLRGFAHGRMNGWQITSLPEWNGETGRVDHSIATVRQHGFCQRIAISRAPRQNGACTRRDVFTDFRRITDIRHDGMVVGNERRKEPTAHFARYS